MLGQQWVVQPASLRIVSVALQALAEDMAEAGMNTADEVSIGALIAGKILPGILPAMGWVIAARGLTGTCGGACVRHKL